MMKAIFMALTVMMTSTVFAQQSSQNKEQVLNRMSTVYNRVNTMTDAEFASMLEKGAGILESKGQTQKAAALRAIENVPGARQSFASKVKGHMDSQSTNGIFFIIYLLCPEMWCQFGDMTCVIPVTVLSLITLDGEPATDF